MTTLLTPSRPENTKALWRNFSLSSKHKKLGTLADIYQSEHLDGTITKVRLEHLHPSDEQPRQDRTLAIADLSASIKKDGLLSPIVVTRDGAKKKDGYRIIAGERRFHAVSKLGWSEVECRIISRKEMDYWRIAVIENLQRENLSAEEEAAAFLKLKSAENISDAELASIIGKSRNYVTEILGIAALPSELLESCRKAGIENKNLLIQVVQAHRNGNAQKFIDAFKSGQIKTVRSARDFNQNRAAATKTTNSKKSTDDYQLNLKGSAVTVSCPDVEAARSLISWLKKEYQPLSSKKR